MTHDDIQAIVDQEFDRMANAGEINTAAKAKSHLHKMANRFRREYFEIFDGCVPPASFVRAWFLAKFIELRGLEPHQYPAFVAQLVTDIEAYFTGYAAEVRKPLAGLPGGDAL